jgi:DNA repair exonuclease SbcCD ATPase subunit
VLYRAQERYDEAEPLYVEALAMYRQVHGAEKDHPDIATSLNNLAALYFYMVRFQEAEELFEEAERIRLCSFGEDHPDVRSVRRSLAVCRAQMASPQSIEMMDAEKQLNDAKKKDAELEKQLNELEKQLNDAKKEDAELKKQLNDAKKEDAELERRLNDAKMKLKAVNAALQRESQELARIVASSHKFFNGATTAPKPTTKSFDKAAGGAGTAAAFGTTEAVRSKAGAQGIEMMEQAAEDKGI